MIHWNSWWDVIIGLAGSVTLGIQYPSKLSVVYICCLEALCLVSTNLRVKYLPPECTAVFPVKLCLCRLFAAERSLHVFTLSFQWTETHFPVWQLSLYSFSHCYCFLKKIYCACKNNWQFEAWLKASEQLPSGVCTLMRLRLKLEKIWSSFVGCPNPQLGNIWSI